MIKLKCYSAYLTEQPTADNKHGYLVSVTAMSKDEAVVKLAQYCEKHNVTDYKVKLDAWPKHWHKRPSFPRAVVESGVYGW